MSYLAKLGINNYEINNIVRYIGHPKTILAPMVDHCDLAFRMLVRDYGCDLCYTAMYHSRTVVENPEFLNQNFATNENDRPLVVQLNGNDPEFILRAAQKFESFCDGIDLNLGCPQNIAKRGNYGAYLLPKYDLIQTILHHVIPSLTVPFSCKIRLLPNFDDTIKLVKMMETEGCQLITVHGRTREQNKDRIGSCDWTKIKYIKSILSIPVFANGGIECFDDIDRCIKETGVDGVMIGEALLEDPTLCQHGYDKNGNQLTVDFIVNKYIDYAIQYHSTPSEIRGHLFKLLHRAFQKAPQLRDILAKNPLNSVESLDLIRELVQQLKDIMASNKDSWLLTDCTLLPDSWYMRHRQNALSQEAISISKQNTSTSSNSESEEEQDFSTCLFSNNSSDDEF